MRRAFDVDVLACPRCGGRLRLLALLEAGTVTTRILRHLALCRGEWRANPSARLCKGPSVDHRPRLILTIVPVARQYVRVMVPRRSAPQVFRTWI